MAKKRKLLPQKHKTKPRPVAPHKSQAKGPNSNAQTGKSETTPSIQKPPQRDLVPTIPFSPEDAILLVGEGDLSFSRALVEHHYCENVTATVLEANLGELTEKYPHVQENVDTIEQDGSKIIYNVDAKKMGPWAKKSSKDSVGIFDRISMQLAPTPGPFSSPHTPSSADRLATKVFNFPHVGGKSTDVNRQVRYNQELLVEFFKRALLSLAPGGTIIVTLFEGEPYTLWNIRDLGRHSGLQVERSFRFQASAYPGYHHARTLGVVRNKKGDVGGGWKGEERPARSFVFVRKDEVPKPVAKKRKRGEDDEDEDEN